MSVNLPVSWGEVVDKVTILDIKLSRLADDTKRQNVQHERKLLDPWYRRALAAQSGVSDLAQALRAVNESLWEIEDAIRDCERKKDFGPAFINLARSVYRHNDQRAALKRELNLLLDSDLVEEKSYTPYD
ncbi:MAG: hypothetical protein KGI56_02565 [Acidobacteriota bacterium]|nr:hypothetical protein [Acidobacteriota bacterium]